MSKCETCEHYMRGAGDTDGYDGWGLCNVSLPPWLLEQLDAVRSHVLMARRRVNAVRYDQTCSFHTASDVKP